MWSKKIQGFSDDAMNIAGEEVQTKRGVLNQKDLNYWQSNPRIYSIVHASDDPKNQEEIQLELQSKEHVRQLIKDIKYQGGLIEPIVVIDKQFDVIEGNSRLAAIRFLSSKDPLQFSNVRCIVLPANISENKIYAYLNQQHIQGKTPWSPYEQAGVIYRLVEGGRDIDSLYSEMNISKRKAEKMYDTYEFMIEHKEDSPTRYSYYDVYLTNRKANKKRELEPNLDEKIVNEIRKGEFTAQEFRNMLPLVCDSPKQFKKFVSGKNSLLGAYEVLEEQGKSKSLVKRLSSINLQVTEMCKGEFDALPVKAQQDCKYKINKILSTLTTLRSQVYGKD